MGLDAYEALAVSAAVGNDFARRLFTLHERLYFRASISMYLSFQADVMHDQPAGWP
jgi:hypothetical protein